MSFAIATISRRPQAAGFVCLEPTASLLAIEGMAVTAVATNKWL